MSRTATAAILDFASAPQRLPDPVRSATLRLLADTLAVGAAGAASAQAIKVREAAAHWGRAGHARLLSGGTMPTPSAAWFNGFAIHCLEWDAVHEGAVVHALSTVTAALLAASDAMGGSDAEAFLTALAIGVDIAAGLGLAAEEPMRFFRPATAGIMGAALAVARLRGLAPDRFGDVLGLALAQASGSMQAHVEASIALPLQIANAARGAIAAVDCAVAGLDGPHDALEGPYGYCALFDRGDLAPYAAGLGRCWRIAETSVKPFPSGRASHGVLGVLADRIAAGTIEPASIETISAFVPPLTHRLVARPARADMRASYARLCLPFLTALMLRDGVIDPRHFTAEQFADPALAAMAARVAVEPDGSSDPNALAPQRLEIEAGGRREVIAIDAVLGSPAAPMSPAQTAQKRALARALAGPGADPALFDDPLSYAIQGIYA